MKGELKVRNNQKGFTLIELLIVVAIIGIIAAIAIPNLLRSRMSANEAAAIGALKTIAGAQTDYNNNSNPKSFSPTLQQLATGEFAGNVPFMDGALGAGEKSGYTFLLNVGAFNTGAGGPFGGSYWAWSATAWPLAYQQTGVRSFFIDGSGVVRTVDNGGGLIENEAPNAID